MSSLRSMKNFIQNSHPTSAVYKIFNFFAKQNAPFSLDAFMEVVGNALGHDRAWLTRLKAELDLHQRNHQDLEHQMEQFMTGGSRPSSHTKKRNKVKKQTSPPFWLKGSKINWNFLATSDIPTAKEFIEIFSGYVNRKNLMVGPTTYFGTMFFKSGANFTVKQTDKFGTLQLVKTTTSEAKPFIPVHPEKLKLVSIPHVSVPTKWHSLHTKKRVKELTWTRPSWFDSEMKTLNGANVFKSSRWGSTIVTIDTKTLKIPVIDAVQYKDSLHEIGCRLIPFGKALPVSSLSKSLGDEIHFISYTFKPRYLNDVAFRKASKNQPRGPGQFVETHPFPHYAFPATKKTKAIMIIGRQSVKINGLIQMVALRIPFGSVLYVSENTMHYDGLTVGEMGISVEPSEERTDTAFFRTNNNDMVRFRIVPPRHCVEKDGVIQYINETSKSHRVCLTKDKVPKYVHAKSKKKHDLPLGACGNLYHKFKECT